MKHGIPLVTAHTRPTGTFVTIRSRDDLDPSSEDITIEHSGRAVTAVPENVGLCQVVDVGPDVTNVKPGDVCFIDFFDVAQAYVLKGEEIYLTQAMALRMTLQLETADVVLPNGKIARHQRTGEPLQKVVHADITPLPGYVLTKHAPERMSVAVTGMPSDIAILPRSMTTTGLVGGRNSDGDPCTFVVYEEVVKVTAGAVQAERDSYYEERRLKARIERLEAELRKRWTAVPPEPGPDVAPGDLVCYCTEFSIKFRAIGEQFRCLPYRNVLAVIDDRAILADYYARNPAILLAQKVGS